MLKISFCAPIGKSTIRPIVFAGECVFSVCLIDVEGVHWIL